MTTANLHPVDEVTPPQTNEEWLTALRAAGRERAAAVGHLHDLLLRAVRHQVSRMSAATHIGHVRREEVITSAANDATMSVLGKLDGFEGRSRFTTWAFKFGILQANVETRRATWADRQIDLDAAPEIHAPAAGHPEQNAEGRDLARTISAAIESELTAHQRTVLTALLIQEVPIDVLSERLGTSRGAVYKTLHDARKRLRAHLAGTGHLAGSLEA